MPKSQTNKRTLCSTGTNPTTPWRTRAASATKSNTIQSDKGSVKPNVDVRLVQNDTNHNQNNSNMLNSDPEVKTTPPSNPNIELLT